MESHFQLTFDFHDPLASTIIICSGKGQEEVMARILGKGPVTFSPSSYDSVKTPLLLPQT